jgi:hypothetical protein
MNYDIKHIIKQVYTNFSQKECLVKCATLFYTHVGMLMHNHILKKIQNHIVNYEQFQIFEILLKKCIRRNTWKWKNFFI